MTSLFDSHRDQEHLTRLKTAIDNFAWQYRCDARPDKKLVFLFPGGMASQLLRATAPSTSAAPYSYYVSWLSGLILAGEANNLRIELNDEDYQDNYVIPDHEIGFNSSASRCRRTVASKSGASRTRSTFLCSAGIGAEASSIRLIFSSMRLFSPSKPRSAR